LKRHVLALLAFIPAVVTAEDVSVAVASNFVATATHLAEAFEESSGHRVRISSGSSGKHYAQIRQGAPFDVFMAADTERPELLCEQGFADCASLLVYAVGELVLWSRSRQVNADTLAAGEFNFLAIANPQLAPYGVAAQDLLLSLRLWDEMQGKLVRGENVAQAMQYVDSGNAQLGLVAASLVLQRDGFVWRVPQHLYRPVEQQAVLISTTEPAIQFMSFLRSEPALEIIRANGYRLP